MNRLYWPVTPFTVKQKTAYSRAFDAAVDHAGSLSRLSTDISGATGEYVSHQALRNWRRNYNIPIPWALVIESYCDSVNFFDLVPWMAPHAGRWLATMSEQITS